MVGAELLESLIAESRLQGFITDDGIAGLFRKPEDHLDEIDALCEHLARVGVPIVPAEVVQQITPASESAPISSTTPAPGLIEFADDLYGVYVSEIRRIPLLAPEEELHLGEVISLGADVQHRLETKRLSRVEQERLRQRVQQGDAARQRFVEANLRLVVSIAWRYRDQGLPLLDLIQEGNIGLLKAVDKWDHRYGYRFSTYATYWIRQAVLRAVAEQSRLIRLPVHIHDELAAARRAAKQLRTELGRRPTIREIASHSSLSERRARFLLQRLPQVCSLDALLCCEEFSLEWDPTEAFLVQNRPCPVKARLERQPPDPHTDDGGELPPCIEPSRSGKHRKSPGADYSMIGYARMALAEPESSAPALRKAMASLLASLPARERRVIRLRFGMEDGETHTLEEIGVEFGVTRERIRQIQSKAIRKLLHPGRQRALKRMLSLRSG